MYCSLDELIKRIGLDELIQLSDTSGTGVIDTDVVTAALQDASDTIDGYIAGRYPLPLAIVPSVLTRICASLARYNLYDNSVTEVVQNNYNDALKFLNSVAKGDIRLGLSVDEQPAVTDSVIEMQSGGSVFNRADSKGFI